ncbi:hypothetical protein GOV03_01540 [Candidatus Woesearchaeota archaeon]|nr:hypothetical protein [Candidatus Woesearchaeota archaeon]
MSSFKKITNSLASLVLGAGLALAPTPNNDVQAAEYKIKSGRECDCTPHYLKDFKRPEDPLENMLEKQRSYKATNTKYSYGTTFPLLNGSIEVQKKIHGVEINLIFPNYVKDKDGLVRHFHSAGVDTYSAKEFRCVVNDQVEYLTRAANLVMKDYEGMLDQIIAVQEKMLKESGALKEEDNLRDLLDKEVPGYEGLKVRDVLFTPDVKIQDFIPTQYYFGDFRALGVSYTDTGIMGINPRARIFDYITGTPITLMHEMTHRNQKLQHSPLMYKFDAELWATLPELVHEDMMHFISHGYMKDIRKVAKILFNFDSKLADTDIAGLELMMGKELEKGQDHQKVRKYMEKVRIISTAIKKTAFEKYIPAFYSNPLYFATLNDFLNDDNASFKLVMYMNYEPTLLGGPEKTRDFVQANESIFEKIAREVIWDVKSNRDNKIRDEELDKIKESLENKLKKMRPERKKALINAAKKFGLPENGDSEEIIKFGLRLYRLGIIEYDPQMEEGLLQNE